MAKLARLPGLERSSRAEGEAHRHPRLRTRYYAFLSYSHRDKELADWLHRELERFRVPGVLAGRLTANGVVPRRLSPVFRDQQDLSAGGDLAEEIKAALAASQFLVVLCSPTAAKSRWTNQEIESFKRTRPEGCVLAAVVAGEPFASDLPGREQEECFPPALRFKYDRRGHQTSKRAEPLAADFRVGGEGKRLAFLKLVAGMLGVGLDELVQREQTRKSRRHAYLAAASIAGMAVTSTLAVTAIQARNQAQEQRREAEGLIGFMLGDLKDKLEPIGRLDALDAVGSRALAYYQAQDKSELSDEALAQRSRALTLMGEIAQTRGDLVGAQSRYQEALASTSEALRRYPNDGQRIFDHAQNVFYVGAIAYQRGLLPQAESEWREYKRLAEQLVALDPGKKEWRLERIYADTNLGIVLQDRRKFREASATFQHGLADIEALAAAEPGNRDYRDQLSETLAWLSQAREGQGALDQALGHRERLLSLLERQASGNANDAPLKYKIMTAHRALGRLFAERGDVGQGFAHFTQSIRIGEELNATEPDNTEWAKALAGSYTDLAELQLGRGDVEQAGQSARAGCDIASRLVQRNSSVLAWRAQLRGDCLSVRARIALSRGSLDEGAGLAAQFLQLATAEAAKNSSATQRITMAKALLLRGEAAKAQGDRTLARQMWQKAASVWPADVGVGPYDLALKAVILEGLGRSAEASAIADQLDATGYRYPGFAKERRAAAS
jgi:eukaryotic-like serine/threonine-protein kinase